ncbi:MAG: delta-aminolevulinic acid dehydratase, partial [Bacteroidetes bacterium]|nr:delta-aminolevulinic acid dehydratase [Bacteroidota bacterium]
MGEQQILSSSLERLQSFIEHEHYKGYDPYDALKSPLFRLPFFKSNKLIRFGAQQLVKRSSLNLRPFLFVPKGLNP